MRNNIASTIAITAFIIFVFALDAGAQSSSRLVVNIPFDFHVGHRLLQGGRYEFETANRQIHPGSLIIRSVTGSGSDAVIVPTMADRPLRSGTSSSIVFNRYGSDHYLSVVNSEPALVALKLGKTRVEKGLAKRFDQTEKVVLRLADATGN